MSGALEQVIAALAAPDGASGALLARRLGVTRAAVWKHIEHLRALGLPIEAAPGRGYRLAGALEWLAKEAILAQTDDVARRLIADLEVRFEIDSTSSELMRRAALARSGTVIFAEHQSAGRGRRGRDWRSPLAANYCFSVLWRFETGLAALSGLSLAVGVAIARALARVGLEGIALKWPNDLLHDGRKLGGILVELAGETGGPCVAVIGVGVNGRMPAAEGARIAQSWTDLAQATTRAGLLLPGRNRIAGLLLSELLPALAQFGAEGLAPFLPEWRRRDALAGRSIRIEQPDSVLDAQAVGVDEQGMLLARIDGETRRIASGEVSVRELR